MLGWRLVDLHGNVLDSLELVDFLLLLLFLFIAAPLESVEVFYDFKTCILHKRGATRDIIRGIDR